MKGLVMRAISMAPVDEMRKRDPLFEQLMQVSPTEFLKTLVPLDINKDGVPVPHVRISTVYACQHCAVELERAVAKGPSWVVVDINRGPGADKIVTGPTS